MTAFPLLTENGVGLLTEDTQQMLTEGIGGSTGTSTGGGGTGAGGTGTGGTTGGGTGGGGGGGSSSGGGGSGGGGGAGSGASNPSGEAPPIGNLTGWRQVVVEDFTIPASTGSWGTSDAAQTVYTGDHNTQWVEYPDGWASTNTGGAPGYNPSTVLSVHDSVLEFSLAPVGGQAMGANPSPILQAGMSIAGGGSQYTTGGIFIFRAKFAAVPGYHSAILLWPTDDGDYQSAESDFPEFDLDPGGSVSAFAHYGGSGSQDEYDQTIDTTAWHSYKQVWVPGVSREYWVDNTLIGTSISQVWDGPQRWQIQIEPTGVLAGGSGSVQIDWVAIYTPA